MGRCSVHKYCKKPSFDLGNRATNRTHIIYCTIFPILAHYAQIEGQA